MNSSGEIAPIGTIAKNVASAFSKEGDDESMEDLEVNFTEMIECNLAHSGKHEWIIDLGATHHMTRCANLILNATKRVVQARIYFVQW